MRPSGFVRGMLALAFLLVGIVVFVLALPAYLLLEGLGHAAFAGDPLLSELLPPGSRLRSRPS